MTDTLVLATRNAGKITEIQAILQDLQVRLLTLEDFPGFPDTPEDGQTFQDNALFKAKTAYERLRLPVLADDSGLEVDALSGAPGVWSARFAGESANDDDNNQKLLTLLSGLSHEKRTARFRCVLALSSSNGQLQTVKGVCEGHIATAACGDFGFGYDPLFVPLGYHQTFGELGKEIKNRFSHRASALLRLKPLLFDIFKPL